MFYNAGSLNLNNISNKETVKRFNINPMFIRSEERNGKYYMYFNNMCFDGTPFLGVLNVDKKILSDKLNKWIRQKDREFVKLEECTNSKSTFSFDIKKWIDKGFESVKPSTDYVTFTRTYRLSHVLPLCVASYGTNMIYEKIITDTFKKYLKENAKLRKDVYGMIENVTNKSLGISHLSIFDYKYNFTDNSISITLKPTFVGGILAGMKLLLNKKETLKKVNFDKTVKKYLNI